MKCEMSGKEMPLRPLLYVVIKTVFILVKGSILYNFLLATKFQKIKKTLYVIEKKNILVNLMKSDNFKLIALTSKTNLKMD